jgi:pimeloyl-[acyl-carrier protein] methyl ester esterase
MINRLVLLPGLDGTGELFADFVAALPRTIRTTIIRYPAQKPCNYADLFLLVKEAIAGLEQFVVLGESFSAPLAVRLAASNSPNLAGLIISAGFVCNPFPNWGFLLKAAARPLLFRLSPPDFIVEYFSLGSSPPSDLKQSVRRTVRSVGPRVLAGRVHEILSCDVRENLTRVKVPIMYLQAAGDRLVGSGCFEEILKVQRSAILVSLDGPHMILQRLPHPCADAVSEFCSSI